MELTSSIWAVYNDLYKRLFRSVSRRRTFQEVTQYDKTRRDETRRDETNRTVEHESFNILSLCILLRHVRKVFLLLSITQSE